MQAMLEGDGCTERDTHGISLSEGITEMLSSWVWACGSNELHRIVSPSPPMQGLQWWRWGQTQWKDLEDTWSGPGWGSAGWGWLSIDNGGDEWLTFSLFYLCAETDRTRRLY